MRVCFFGLYDPDNPRNAVLRRGLELNGVQVLQCNAEIESGKAPSLLPMQRVRKLAARFHLLASTVDAMVVPEFNQALVPLAVALARRHRLPVVVDFLVSIYDSAVRDRGRSRLRPRASLVYLGDALALRLATRAITDTRADAEFFAQNFGASLLTKMSVVPVGAPEWLFSPSPLKPRDRRHLTVLFYGSFIPLHGVHHIVDAAHALRGDGRFKFVLLGGGQTLSSVRATYAARSSGNVEFRERVSPEILPSVVREADICLGVFGTSDKARRVVPNKVWQALAAGRPVVTGDGRGAREFLTDGHDCLLVPHGDGERLASALVRLADDGDLAARLAENGARLVHDRYTSRPIGRLLCGVIEAAIDSAARRRVTSIPE